MNEEPLKVALTGALRSGKDSVAWHMFYKHGFSVPIAFGNRLKTLYHEALPWVPKDPKPRAGYQRFGQTMREQFGEDIWIRHVEQTIDYYLSYRSCTGIVVSDLRQPNEYDWLKAQGFTIIRVVAPSEQRITRANQAGDAFVLADLSHDTETHSDGFDVDYELVNDGTLIELEAKVDALMAELKAEWER